MDKDLKLNTIINIIINKNNMKKVVIGIFSAREDAEKAINRLHNELSIKKEDISYIYRNVEGSVREIPADKISSDTAGEGARKGAAVGGTLGALAGIATVAGIIPAIGPFIAAGTFTTLLGATTAIGTTAVGAAAGAATGGILGAIVNLGVGSERAQHYSDRVRAGDIFLAVNTNNDRQIIGLLENSGAIDIDTLDIAR